VAQEELVFQLLEAERRTRTERIVTEKKINTEDCLVIGILRLNGEIVGLYERIDDMDKRLSRRIDNMDERFNNRADETNKRMDETNKRIDWMIALILAMWISIMAALIPILLKLIGVI
jgi:cell division protein ZapA (FtsZ GTPase activity inhibitor)